MVNLVWVQIKRIPIISERKVNIPVRGCVAVVLRLTNLAEGFHNRCYEDVMTDNILIVKKLLGLVEEGSILRICNEL